MSVKQEVVNITIGSPEHSKGENMIQPTEVDAIGEFTLAEKVEWSSAGKQPAGYEILDSDGEVRGRFDPDEKDTASGELRSLALRHGYVPQPIAEEGDCFVWKKVVNGKTIYVVSVDGKVEFFDSYDKAMEVFSGAVKRQRKRRRPIAGSTPGF